jgi:CIC family chloride channel protein
VGIVTASGLEESMRSNVLDATVADLRQDVPPVRADETLEQALERLVTHGATGLPVLDAPDGRVIGWLSHHDLLAAYGARLGGQFAPVAPNQGPDENAAPLASRAPRPWLRDYRIVELEFTSGAPPVGMRMSDIAWPALSLPVVVRRDGQQFSPVGDTILSQGDRVTVLVAHGEVDQLSDQLIRAVPNRPSLADGGSDG